jgi:LuxR family maltose regulon positive regulatory protein
MEQDPGTDLGVSARPGSSPGMSPRSCTSPSTRRAKGAEGATGGSRGTAGRLSLPRVATPLLRRARLERRLSEWSPVTVLRGLRGSGKTTLVAMWLESQRRDSVRAVWVAARSPSRPRDTFEACLSRSLRRATDAWPRTTQDLANGGLGELEAILLRAPPQAKFVLVIDNFQHVDDARVLSGLVCLVERHRHFHLIVCCPGRHAIESQLAGGMAVNVIGPAELLLTTDEVIGLAGILGVALGRVEAERLRAALGAWALPIRASLLGDGGSCRGQEAAKEFLRTQVLSDVVDPAVLEQLMHFSLADTLSRPLVRDLCGESEPDRLLESMEASGLVDRVGTGDGSALAIPAPLRCVLQDRFKAGDSVLVARFHRRLAVWFAHQDGREHLAEALHHAVEGGDWDLMDALWSEDMVTLVEEDPELVCSTLERLPDTVLAARPSMQVVGSTLKVAWATMGDEWHRSMSQTFADGCARLIRSCGPTASLSELLVIGTGYLMHLRLHGHVDEAVAFAHRMDARIAVLSERQRPAADTLAWFHLERGVTLTLLDSGASAVRSYERSWELGRGSTPDLVRTHAAANLALTFGAAGETERAGQWLARSHDAAVGLGRGADVAAIGAHLAAGLLALDRLSLAEALAELAYLGDGSSPAELWPYIAYLNAQCALHAGEPEMALVRLDQVQHGHEGVPKGAGMSSALLTRARADLLISCGRGVQAESILGAEGVPLSPMHRVPATRIRLLQGGHAGSGEADPPLLHPEVSSRDRMELLLLGATSALRRMDGPAARHLVNQALSLYADTKVVRPFATVEPGTLDELLGLADLELEAVDAAKLTGLVPVYPTSLALVHLSDREQSVLSALAVTRSRQAIADSLYVSVNTVKTQLASIYRKLGSTNREEALHNARAYGILSVAQQ